MKLIPFAALMAMLAAPVVAAPADPYIWLEKANDPKALEWVRAQDAVSLKRLESDPDYQRAYTTALSLAQSNDRIPEPSTIGGQIYNLWQDATHVQGIWRRTSVADYRSANPHWTIMLDLDALSRQEGRHWVWKNVQCLEPEERLCLISLSDGGEDAVTTREFDLAAGQFVPNGFLIPHAKQDIAWEDRDDLIVATDWGAGAMTSSGYPFIVKRLHRGQNLTQAQEIFRGAPQDVAVQPAQLSDGQGHDHVILQRGLDFFRSETRLLTPAGAVKLDLPEKLNIEALLDDRLIFTTAQKFTAHGVTVPSGALAALDLAHPDAAPEVIFAPGARQSIDNVAATQGKLIASVYDNVRGRAVVFRRDDKGWSNMILPLPDNASVALTDTNLRNDRVFVSVTSFLTPTTLYSVDLAANFLPAVVKSLPPKFDASRDVAEQFEARSSDGTRIPYFLVHPKGMKRDGGNPTLLYGYGGFQVSLTPFYSPVTGKLWLEPGGVYALANIRGGGEFGPAWHEAALKTHRQIAYDDFTAVARDLIARHVTSPQHLGIQGGSNGGLLMGVEFTQHPELFKAVVIELPLLDMLRFEQINAGASWVGEYGSASVPAERKFLARISPYNNLRAGVTYPEPFIFTTTKDDRVGPGHARKFAARLAELHQPYLYYESIEGGHGSGANLQESARERALEMTYLHEKLAQ